MALEMDSITIKSLLLDPDMGPEYKVAVEHLNKGNHSEALVIVKQMQRVFELFFYDNYWKILKCKALVAKILNKQNKTTECINLLKEIWQATQIALGPSCKTTLSARINYANALIHGKRIAESLAEHMQITKLVEEEMKTAAATSPSFTHADLTGLNFKTAALFQLLRKYQEAIQVYVKMLVRATQISGPLNPDVLVIKTKMAQALFQKGEIERSKFCSHELMKDCIKAGLDLNSSKTYQEAKVVYVKCLHALTSRN